MGTFETTIEAFAPDDRNASALFPESKTIELYLSTERPDCGLRVFLRYENLRTESIDEPLEKEGVLPLQFNKGVAPILGAMLELPEHGEFFTHCEILQEQRTLPFWAGHFFVRERMAQNLPGLECEIGMGLHTDRYEGPAEPGEDYSLGFILPGPVVEIIRELPHT